MFMFKFLYILSLILFLNNCGVPGTSLLGPAFTGATTKSVARTSISYGSNQFLKKLEILSENHKNKSLLNFHK
jgi:hypothetical protein